MKPGGSHGLLWIAIIYAFLLMPILLVVVNSFNASELLTFPPEGFSLRWYRAFADSDSFVEAFKFSLTLAAESPVIATLIGFFAVYGIQRTLATLINLHTRRLAWLN